MQRIGSASGTARASSRNDANLIETRVGEDDDVGGRQRIEQGKHTAWSRWQHVPDLGQASESFRVGVGEPHQRPLTDLLAEQAALREDDDSGAAVDAVREGCSTS